MFSKHYSDNFHRKQSSMLFFNCETHICLPAKTRLSPVFLIEAVRQVTFDSFDKHGAKLSPYITPRFAQYGMAKSGPLPLKQKQRYLEKLVTSHVLKLLSAPAIRIVNVEPPHPKRAAIYLL